MKNVFQIDIDKLLKFDLTEVLYTLNIIITTVIFGYQSGENYWKGVYDHVPFLFIAGAEGLIIAINVMNYILIYLLYKKLFQKIFK